MTAVHPIHRFSTVTIAVLVLALSSLMNVVHSQGTTIVDTLSVNNSTSTLVTAVKAANGLVSALSSGGPFTVFAPTNEAFDKLLPGVLDYLLTNPDVLTKVLQYHVTQGMIESNEIGSRSTIVDTLLPDETISVRRQWVWKGFFHGGLRREVRVNNKATVMDADVMASNGIIHLINQVLFPPDFDIPMDLVETIRSEGYSTLMEALRMADLVGALRTPNATYTVFVPTNQAFNKLPDGTMEYLLQPENKVSLQKILAYHVLPQEIPAGAILNQSVTSAETILANASLSFSVRNSTTVFVNDKAKVIQANIEATNGIAHVINQVLIPEDVTIPSNLVTVASSLPDQFSTLVKVLTATGLDESLTQDGPFTVFAPTNDAFAALDPTILQGYLADPTGDLTDILKYHVVKGLVPASDAIELAKENKSLRMLNGDVVKLSLTNNGTTVTLNNDTDVIQTDISALNGIIHVIDKILVVPSDENGSDDLCTYWEWLCDFISIFKK